MGVSRDEVWEMPLVEMWQYVHVDWVYNGSKVGWAVSEGLGLACEVSETLDEK